MLLLLVFLMNNNFILRQTVKSYSFYCVKLPAYTLHTTNCPPWCSTLCIRIMDRSISGTVKVKHTTFGKAGSACFHLSPKCLDFDVDLWEVFINHEFIKIFGKLMMSFVKNIADDTQLVSPNMTFLLLLSLLYDC